MLIDVKEMWIYKHKKKIKFHLNFDILFLIYFNLH